MQSNSGRGDGLVGRVCDGVESSEWKSFESSDEFESLSSKV